MTTQIFTLESATRMLPLLSRITREIQICARLQSRFLRWQESGTEGINHLELHEKLSQLETRIDECKAEVSALGCTVGDCEGGVVNFPAQHEGRLITLTWKRGDPAVAHFFEADETHGARRPFEGNSSMAGESSHS